MDNRVEEIQQYIGNIDFVSIDTPFTVDDELIIKGQVVVTVNDEISLSFTVTILPEYPLKRYNTETITFSNPDLITYGHVMEKGSICIHTSHCVDLQRKLLIDFNSLRRWIKEYFIEGKKDTNYEHLILQPEKFKGRHYAYFFTEVDYQFQGCEYGFFEYIPIQSGKYYDAPVHNYVVQSFFSKNNKKLVECQWSDGVKNLSHKNKNSGLFIFINNPPATHGKFAFKNWEELETYVSKPFIKFLSEGQNANRKIAGNIIPLLVGYRITETEIHWQSILMEIGKFPIATEKVNQQWQGYFLDAPINWGITKNCSYQYFFGRGRMDDKITKGKVLIIGVGAIGSMIATTLTRGGCKIIDMIDYDVKEPENVCRSEYRFNAGINNKVDELRQTLISISPFINTGTINADFFNLYAKVMLKNHEASIDFKKALLQYDVIFDCSTDNDLMFVLDELQLDNLITLSITNKARAVACATEPKSYSWMINQFEQVLENDTEDLYNPTGCWSPTFKASYNDINTLIQHAIKHINLKFSQGLPLRNFVLDAQEDFIIKLKEF
ncbi:ThiF family adenylyltransferase [Rurimicrobium arvi]|uniref:THIF-type NAD/FAD binding fold domain-containing protein n=1 Tax=Rurimicrobium arvi TaxID=2049916 RepID=A0ABP8MV14_9BACT